MRTKRKIITKPFLLFVAFFFFIISTFAQIKKIEGIVFDSLTHGPLAFVPITINNTNNGCITDMNGKFSYTSNIIISSVKFSYLGYVERNIKPNSAYLTVLLKSTYLYLPEFTVSTKDNPALRIIRRVIENRKANNPENLNSFKYHTYNKLILSAIPTKTDTNKKLDSLEIKMREYAKNADLFIIESVTEHLYKNPSNHKETVLASRVSGFKNPMLTLLSSQMQSFSFYDNSIRIMNKSYLSPLSNASLNKYDFSIIDTVVQNKDSIFTINFIPKNGANIDGMKGVLYINTNGYAIQNVIAEPIAKSGLINLKIHQKYAQIDGNYWFPTQLNAQLSYGDLTISKTNIKGTAQTTISDIEINKPIDSKEFDRVEFQINPDASKKDSSFWSKYRTDSLTQRNKVTFSLIDSIGKAQKFDLKLKLVESFVKGQIPYKFINFDLDKFLHINKYEGYRLGLGAHSNDKIVSFANVGGYFAYGFKDKQWKYGGDMKVIINKRNDIGINAEYKTDVAECGGVDYYFDKQLSSKQKLFSETFRYLQVDRMFKYDKYAASVEFRMFQDLSMNLGLVKRDITEFGNIQWAVNNDYPKVLLSNYSTTEAVLDIKYAYKEKYQEIFNTLISQGSKYPVFLAQISKGSSKYFSGDIDFTKINAKLLYSIDNVFFGKSYFKIESGYINKPVPYSLMFCPYATSGKFPVYAANTFVTMQPNEFLSSSFVSGYFTHDFGKLLLNTRFFKSSIAIATGAYFGEQRFPYSIVNTDLKNASKGYFESGLMINNIINGNYDGLGLGCFYRYGAYHLPREKDNFTYTMTITLNF